MWRRREQLQWQGLLYDLYQYISNPLCKVVRDNGFIIEHDEVLEDATLTKLIFFLSHPTSSITSHQLPSFPYLRLVEIRIAGTPKVVPGSTVRLNLVADLASSLKLHVDNRSLAPDITPAPEPSGSGEIYVCPYGMRT